jgi:hypothetical protein
MHDVRQNIDGTAFALLHLAPADRERVLCEVFDQVLAKHPDLTAIPSSIVAFVAAVLERIDELDQLPAGTA